MPNLFVLGYNHNTVPVPNINDMDPKSSQFKRTTSYTTVNVDESVQGTRSVEYFFASDARYVDVCSYLVHINLLLLFSAVIEYTNRVLYLEDNDVAAVTTNGGTVL